MTILFAYKVIMISCVVEQTVLKHNIFGAQKIQQLYISQDVIVLHI